MTAKSLSSSVPSFRTVASTKVVASSGRVMASMRVDEGRVAEVGDGADKRGGVISNPLCPFKFSPLSNFSGRWWRNVPYLFIGQNSGWLLETHREVDSIHRSPQCGCPFTRLKVASNQHSSQET